MRTKILSKSNYLAGLQCPKLLWIKLNAKELIPEIDEETKQIFDKGHEIGNFAKKLFKEGIDIPTDNFVKNLSITKEKLHKNKPLFEPAFLKNNLYSRADILNPKKNGLWDIYEVKSGSTVKEVNIHDLSFQKHVYTLYGLKIDKCYLINKNHNEESKDVNKFFRVVDLTNQVERISKDIDKRIEIMQKIISSNTNPKIAMGEQCTNPYKCQLIPYCESLKKNSLFAHHV